MTSERKLINFDPTSYNIGDAADAANAILHRATPQHRCIMYAYKVPKKTVSHHYLQSYIARTIVQLL